MVFNNVQHPYLMVNYKRLRNKNVTKFIREKSRIFEQIYKQEQIWYKETKSKIAKLLTSEESTK